MSRLFMYGVICLGEHLVSHGHLSCGSGSFIYDAVCLGEHLVC